MTISLWLFALFLFFTYAFYFLKIIWGKPEEFEYELLKSLANWMVSRGKKSRPQLWLLLFISILLEVAYFSLVLTTITSPALIIMTSFFIGVEVIHLTMVGISFNKFFAGKKVVKDIFNWKIERLSGILFFTHAFLVMICLAFF